jgi:hypothetical protein
VKRLGIVLGALLIAALTATPVTADVREVRLAVKGAT